MGRVIVMTTDCHHRQLFRSYANMVVSGNPYEQTLWLRFTVRRWRYFTGIELAILKDKTTALLNELWSANLPIRLKKSSFSAISLSVSIFVQGFSQAKDLTFLLPWLELTAAQTLFTPWLNILEATCLGCLLLRLELDGSATVVS